ncbi:MAG TPA: hypothetical protein HPP90_13860 [Deltaproteobacteria bacterium]|nr:hypothetical protein [Deltaproteobacteria bacterium]
MEDLNKTSEIPEELELKLPNEKRNHTRKSFITAVDFVCQGRAYSEFAKDISANGLYIQTSGSFSVGQEVALTFPFPDTQKHIKITGCIARVTDTGIGVQFDMGRFLDQLSSKSKYQFTIQRVDCFVHNGD